MKQRKTALRWKSIKVQFQSEKFQTHIKTFTGWTAQIIQHEIDHCEESLISHSKETLILNILIIGNGFDLAHNLPTKYEHFLRYVDVFKRSKDICKQESIQDKREITDIEDKKFIIHFANLYKEKPSILFGNIIVT